MTLRSTIMRILREEENREKEMIDGIVDMLNQVEDIQNRKEMALDRLEDFENEGIDIDPEEFLSRCGLGPENEIWKATIEGQDIEGSPIAFVQYASSFPTRKVHISHIPEKTFDQGETFKLKERTPIEKSEDDYPILLIKLKNGKLKVLNGKDEIRKAKEMNQPVVKAKILPSEDVVDKFGKDKED